MPGPQFTLMYIKYTQTKMHVANKSDIFFGNAIYILTVPKRRPCHRQSKQVLT